MSDRVSTMCLALAVDVALGALGPDVFGLVSPHGAIFFQAPHARSVLVPHSSGCTVFYLPPATRSDLRLWLRRGFQPLRPKASA